MASCIPWLSSARSAEVSLSPACCLQRSRGGLSPIKVPPGHQLQVFDFLFSRSLSLQMHIDGDCQHCQQLPWWLSMEKEPGSPPKLLLPCSEGCKDGEQRGGRQSRSAQARARSRTQHGSQLSKSGTGTARLCPGNRAGDSRPSKAPARSPKAFHRKSYPKRQSATLEL